MTASLTLSSPCGDSRCPHCAEQNMKNAPAEGGRQQARLQSGGQWWKCPKARSTNCRATATVANDLIQLWVGGWRSTSCQPLVANYWYLAAHGCCPPLEASVNLGGAKVVLPKRQQSHNRRGAPLNSGWVGAASYRTLAAQRWPLAARR